MIEHTQGRVAQNLDRPERGYTPSAVDPRNRGPSPANMAGPETTLPGSNRAPSSCSARREANPKGPSPSGHDRLDLKKPRMPCPLEKGQRLPRIRRTQGRRLHGPSRTTAGAIGAARERKKYERKLHRGALMPLLGERVGIFRRSRHAASGFRRPARRGDQKSRHRKPVGAFRSLPQ